VPGTHEIVGVSDGGNLIGRVDLVYGWIAQQVEAHGGDGGPAVFWGKDSSIAPSAFIDWDVGNYKGECADNQPLDGLSRVPGAAAAHALHCAPFTLASAPNGCTLRDFSAGDNRGTDDGGWDWDWGYRKGECGAGEYVRGVSQTGSGAAHEILCCPGSVRHQSCSVQTFANGDAGFHGADWDWGYLKGQCADGQYVAGVSGEYGGGARSILCCTP
jgi:endoglucanase